MQIKRQIDKPGTAIIQLTPEERQQAYEEQKLLFLTKDASNHVGEYLEQYNIDTDRIGIPIDEAFYIRLAEDYIRCHDCNIDENSMWQSIVENHMKSDILVPDFLNQIKARTDSDAISKNICTDIAKQNPVTKDMTLERAMLHISIDRTLELMYEYIWN